jgi:hypothetical protein
MQTFRLSKGNFIFNLFEGILSIVIFIFSIDLFSNGISSYILIILSLYMAYSFLLPLFLSSITITENSIELMTIDSKLLIKKENIIDIIEYAPSILGTTGKFLQLKEKVQLYNRGVNKLFLFWYKTNDVNISQFDRNIVGKLKEFIK